MALRTAYGETIRQLEDKWVNEVAGREIETALGPQRMPPSQYEIYTRIYSIDVLRSWRELFVRAKSQVPPNSIEWRRIGLYEREMLLPLATAAKRFRTSISVERELLARTARPAQPNLLVNGSMGIAVGMATNIPPHNLREVIDGSIYLVDHPDASMDELMQFIKGPDFPTGGIILGKPKDSSQCHEYLKMLSGKPHKVTTGCTLIFQGKKTSFHVDTTVFFRELSDEEIEWYISTGEPFDKAGGYGIQGKGALLIESISGDYFNVVGLPVSALYSELKKYQAV